MILRKENINFIIIVQNSFKFQNPNIIYIKKNWKLFIIKISFKNMKKDFKMTIILVQVYKIKALKKSNHKLNPLTRSNLNLSLYKTEILIQILNS